MRLHVHLALRRLKKRHRRARWHPPPMNLVKQRQRVFSEKKANGVWESQSTEDVVDTRGASEESPLTGSA